MIWKLLMAAEQTFRKLNAPEHLVKVYAGIQYEDGKLPEWLRFPVKEGQIRAA